MQRLLTSLLRRLAPPDDPSSDAAVLRRFADHRDETAFELLVWRHGGLVLGVCRRMLRDSHAADDAFQATFLVLARKAGAVRGSLPGWLHQVARRVCLRARKKNPVPLEPGSERVAEITSDRLLSAELRAILDEEVARLPEKLRLAVLLCYLQAHTTDDAAKFLGIPQGTVLSRLDAARKRLRGALTRRGVTVPATLFATAINTPVLNAEECKRATATALDYLNSTALISVPSQLAHEVTQMTTRKTALGMMAAVVLVSGVGTGVGLVMAQGGKTPPTKVADKPPAEQKADPLKAEQKPNDAELQAKQRDRRLNELDESQHRVSRQIEGLEERRIRAIADTGGEVDPAALQAKLGEIDKEILNYEERIASKPNELKSVESWITDMKRGRFNDEWNPDAFEARILAVKGVKELAELYEQRKKNVSSMEGKFQRDSPAMKRAEEDLQAAKSELQKARDDAKAQVVAKFREKEMTNATNQLNEISESQKRLTSELKVLRDKRIALVVRIQRAKTSLKAQELIDDEIEVLREIRKRVLRERLLLEMGLEDKTR